MLKITFNQLEVQNLLLSLDMLKRSFEEIKPYRVKEVNDLIRRIKRLNN